MQAVRDITLGRASLAHWHLLSPEHHLSAVLPPVSANSVDRSCWRASVRFNVILRVGSSGLLSDPAGDPDLHPAEERGDAPRHENAWVEPRAGSRR